MVLGEEFVDTEENQYRTISIENQVWTIDNYKGTHYRNCLLYTSPSPRD